MTRIPVIDCTGPSDQPAGLFDESRLASLPHWFGRRAADHYPILFLIGPTPYLYERSILQDLVRLSHPNDRVPHTAADDNPQDEIIYLDRASLIRRITLTSVLFWFHEQRRNLPPAIRSLHALSDVEGPALSDVEGSNASQTSSLYDSAPASLTGPPAPKLLTFSPTLLSATTAKRPTNHRAGRPRLHHYQALRRQALITDWLRAKSQGISQSNFCAQRGIPISSLARTINWSTKRRAAPKPLSVSPRRPTATNQSQTKCRLFTARLHSN